MTLEPERRSTSTYAVDWIVERYRHDPDWEGFIFSDHTTFTKITDTLGITHVMSVYPETGYATSISRVDIDPRKSQEPIVREVGIGDTKRIASYTHKWLRLDSTVEGRVVEAGLRKSMFAIKSDFESTGRVYWVDAIARKVKKDRLLGRGSFEEWTAAYTVPDFHWLRDDHTLANVITVNGRGRLNNLLADVTIDPDGQPSVGEPRELPSDLAPHKRYRIPNFLDRVRMAFARENIDVVPGLRPDEIGSWLVRRALKSFGTSASEIEKFVGKNF